MSVTAERESGIDSMTISTPGSDPVTITGDEAGSALDKLEQASEALKRVDQLTFRVGGDAIGQSIFGSLSISGSAPIERDLDLGDEVRIQVIAADGAVVATSAAIVGAPNFKAHRDKYGEIMAVERAHRAKVASE